MAELELDLHLRTLMHYSIGQALCKLLQLFLNKVVFKVSLMLLSTFISVKQQLLTEK